MRGSSEQLATASQVIDRLQENAKSMARQRTAEERHKAIERLTQEINNLYAEGEAIKSDYYAKKDAANLAQADAMALQNRPNESSENIAKVRDRAAAAQKAMVEAGYRMERLERDLRSREHMLEQLRAMEPGGDASTTELSRLRTENAELRSRIEKLEDRKSR
jgi:chromosome segregation ATPase